MTEPIDYERLSTYLKALAHPARLEILYRLRVPSAAADIVVKPRRKDADLSAERAMSRQSILEHIEVLEGVGVVGRLPEAEGSQWVTSAQHVFALLEDLRKLTTIEPAARVDVDATMAGAQAKGAAWAPQRSEAWTDDIRRTPGPKLVLATGPWEGRAFELKGAGPWTLGRSRSRDVALTYDPFASAENASLAKEGTRFTLTPDASARNPVRVNFRAITGSQTLQPGDLVGIGRSMLVFQSA